ncbi:MAG: polysaccharide deacetylase family protein, partial [Saprospiraceae bacterium]|nr:polysaccharide deacetylase family protein [Saprospiraceae bacterium]
MKTTMMIKERIKQSVLSAILGFCLSLLAIPATHAQSFPWPEGKKAALTLTFDDARLSHPDVGLELFRELDAKATFYVVPGAVQQRLEGWKQLVRDGHEIGNHTINHPCTGNFDWSRDKALEDYNLASMRQELLECNQQIQALLGVTPVSFAYTCGNTFVGRGQAHESYVPLIAELFESGRGWLNEPQNDPAYADYALLQGNEMDGKDFPEIKAMIDASVARGNWLLLAGHEIGEEGHQTTRTEMLRALVAYAKAPDSPLWLATVTEVVQHIENVRTEREENLAAALSLAATFDQGVSADFAIGDDRLYSAPSYDRGDLRTANYLPEETSINPETGKHGGTLEFKRKGRPIVFFNAKENMSYDPSSWSGTVSMWLSVDPENDLAPGYTDPIQITDSNYDDAALWVDFSKTNPRDFRMGAFGDRSVWNPNQLSPDTNTAFIDRLIVAEDRPFSRGKWTHICMVFDRLNTDLAQGLLYVNG